MLFGSGCGDQDAPPQEAFVVTNETERSLWIVSGQGGEPPETSLSRASNYSPEIEPSESWRQEYGVSPNGEPGGCWRNIQMLAVHLPDGFMDDVRFADTIDPAGAEVVKIWPPQTCFDVDEQVEVIG